MSDSAFAAALEARDDESSDEEEVPDNVVVCEIHRLLVLWARKLHIPHTAHTAHHAAHLNICTLAAV